MTACLICRHGPGAASRTVCPACETRLRALLREIDAQRPLLAASLHLDTAPADGRTGSGGRAHSPLPVRGDVLTLLGAGATGTVPDPYGDQSGPVPLDTLLAGWAHAVAAELAELAAEPFRRHRTTWSTWLAAYMPQVVTAQWADAFHEELADIVHRIRAITRTEPRRRPKTAPCPSCAAFALFETDWQPYVDCEACGLLLTPSEYDQHAAATLPPLYRLGLQLVVSQHAHDQEHAA
jgi:hypothetical protein